MPKKNPKQPSKPTAFGLRVKELLADKFMTAFELHEATGINHSVISRLISGSQSWVSPEMLGKIAAALCKTAEEQAGLIVAKLTDEKSVPALPAAEALVRITVGGKASTELGRINRVPKQLEAPLKVILDQARQKPSVEALIIQLAATLES